MKRSQKQRLPVKAGGVKVKRSQFGILLGTVLSGLLVVAIALSMNKERRQQLKSRLEEIRKTLPGTQQLKQSAQQAATKAKEAGSHLGEQVQESASKVGHRTQELFDTAKQTVASIGGNRHSKDSH